MKEVLNATGSSLPVKVTHLSGCRHRLLSGLRGSAFRLLYFLPHGNWVRVVDQLPDVLAHVIEGIAVVGVRLRRSRDREGDVVATIVIALVARILIVSFRIVHAWLVHWFPDRGVPLRQKHLLVEGLRCLHFVLHACLGAVFANAKEVLNFFTNQGELALLDRLQKAGKVIITEDLNLVILLVLGEHRIDKEDR